MRKERNRRKDEKRGLFPHLKNIGSGIKIFFGYFRRLTESFRYNKTCVILIVLIFLSACSTAPRYTSEVKPKRETPSERRKKVMYGVASYYGKDFHGKLTANGETFDMYGVSAAHKTLPFNTVIRVTNLENNRSLIVRINDRGPYVEGRILDLSYGAAKKLGFLDKGTTKIKIEVLELGDDEYMKRE
jgi:rare lipoprotein A